MLTLHVPRTRLAERQYVATVVLGEFLGLDWQLVAEDRADVLLTLAGSEQALLFPDVLFAAPPMRWLTADLLPSAVLPKVPAPADLAAVTGQPDLPVLFGAAVTGQADADVTVDIFGSIFFLLTRYEEIVADPGCLDRHGRFPAQVSVSGRAGLLRRPIVDEYVEWLWHRVARIWPRLQRRPRTFRLRVSCDVDRPFDERLRSLPALLRDLLGFLQAGDLAAFGRRAAERATLVLRGDDGDPNFAFDDYMSICEAADLHATFHFLCGGSTPYDATYQIGDARIVDLLRRIGVRGHGIGLHGSYGSAFDDGMLVREAETLRRVLAANGIPSPVTEGRQHYLRWQADGGWRAAEAAGLAVDSTLGYAEQAGFRCGTCHEFPVFDLRAGRMLKLRERPLVAMDVTFLSPLYRADRSPQGILEEIGMLASTCRRYQGEFTLLWHNNGIGRAGAADMFRRALGAAHGERP